jgi:hypothetical protein
MPDELSSLTMRVLVFPEGIRVFGVCDCFATTGRILVRCKPHQLLEGEVAKEYEKRFLDAAEKVLERYNQ